jgi:hypothetical protein
MAAKVAIAILTETSIKRIEAALGEGFTLPTQGKDRDMLRALQFAAIADCLEAREASKAVAIMVDSKPAKATAAKARR